MTLMLASVSSPEEALTARMHGADIIDLKDPSSGALGALPVATVAAVVEALSGDCPTSATTGDLQADARQVAQAAQAMAASGVDFVKIGLFEDDAPAAFLRALAPGSNLGARAVLVMFVDREPDFALLPVVEQAGFHGVMLDTADKHAGGLRDCLPPTVLARFVREARSLGLMSGLAGALRVDDVAPLLSLAPDLLGFRTALCGAGGRTAGIEAQAVRRVRDCIPRWQPAAPAGGPAAAISA